MNLTRPYLFAAALALASSAHAAGDAINGKALYQARCAACHSADYNGAGPAH
jgi:cytochrome c